MARKGSSGMKQKNRNEKGGKRRKWKGKEREKKRGRSGSRESAGKRLDLKKKNK